MYRMIFQRNYLISLLSLTSFFALVFSFQVTAQEYWSGTKSTSSSINRTGNIGLDYPNPIYTIQTHNNNPIISIGDKLFLSSGTPSQSIKISNNLVNKGGWQYTDNTMNGAIISMKNGQIDLIGSTTPGSTTFRHMFTVNSATNKAIFPQGNVGIGTSTLQSGYALTIKGKAIMEEVKVQDISGADFVFEENYELPTLEYLEEHIRTHKHLPDVPSAKEMQENGILLGQMDIILLQKIEELTLHTIEQNRILKMQQSKIDELEEKLNRTRVR